MEILQELAPTQTLGGAALELNLANELRVPKREVTAEVTFLYAGEQRASVPVLSQLLFAAAQRRREPGRVSQFAALLPAPARQGQRANFSSSMSTRSCTSAKRRLLERNGGRPLDLHLAERRRAAAAHVRIAPGLAFAADRPAQRGGALRRLRPGRPCPRPCEQASYRPGGGTMTPAQQFIDALVKSRGETPGDQQRRAAAHLARRPEGLFAEEAPEGRGRSAASTRNCWRRSPARNGSPTPGQEIDQVRRTAPST